LIVDRYQQNVLILIKQKFRILKAGDILRLS